MTTRLDKKIKILLVIGIILTTGKVNAIYNNDKIVNININKTLDLNQMAIKLDEIEENDKYSILDTYVGDLTGYAANCPKCGGHLGCNGMDVRNGTTSYKDLEYGEVKIVASSKKLQCGSIIKFDLKGEETYAIVLDRGVTGNDIDLLVESESYASKNIGRKKIKYDLIRKGWTKGI